MRERQKFFAGKELPSLYRAEAKDLLAHYYSLYAVDGFSDHVAIDDCDVAQFAKAIMGTSATAAGIGSETVSNNQPTRSDPQIVLNSCRKYQGAKLVSCTSNGDDPKAGYTIRHCGELIRRDAPADQLKMDFIPEAIETERAIRTLSIIAGPEEAYQLEDLAAKLHCAQK